MQTHHHVDLPCQAVAGSRCTHNPRAKFHALTRAGQKHLNKKAANWERVSKAITRVLTIGEA